MEKSNKKVWWWVVIIVIVLIVIFATSKDTTPANASPIKFGFVGPLTGDLSTLGNAARIAVEIATTEINENGGINGQMIEAIYEDGKCTPTSASNAGQKLLFVDKVSAIIGGGCSGETGAFVKNAMDEKVITMSYCSSAPTLTGSGKYFFRNYPSDTYAGAFIAEYLYNKGIRKMAVLYPVTDYGIGLKDSFTKKFESLGGSIPVVEGAQQSSRDYKTSLVKIKNAGVDYIFMPLYTEGGIPAVKQIKELGLNIPIITADTGSDPRFQKEIPSDIELNFVITNSPVSDNFIKKFKEVDPVTDPTICAPQAYDAVNLIANAMKKVGLDADNLQEEIRKNQYQGVSGLNAFDENGDLIGASYVVKKSKGGVVEIAQ